MNYASLNRADPNTIADVLRQIAFGRVMVGQIPQCIRRKDGSVNSPYNLATLGTIVLPNEAKAASIVRATAIAGTAAAGELAAQAFGATPATTQIAVAPNGDLVFLLTDAYTAVDVTYIPERGFSVETFFPVVSNVLTLPNSVVGGGKGVALLTEAEAVSGTSTGKKIILVPGSGAPSAGQCRLNLAKTTVTFATADAVTRARVKLLCVETTNDLQGVLIGTDNVL